MKAEHADAMPEKVRRRATRWFLALLVLALLAALGGSLAFQRMERRGELSQYPFTWF